MNASFFFSQELNSHEPAFLWNGAEIVDEKLRRLAFGAVTRPQRWQKLMHKSPIELMYAPEFAIGVRVTLGIRIQTDSTDHRGRHSCVDGVQEGFWKPPSADEGRRFLVAAREALAGSTRRFDEPAVEAAINEIIGQWAQLQWPTALDLAAAVRRGRTRVGSWIKRSMGQT